MFINQFLPFLIYIVAGIIICIFFDFFRSLRKAINTSNIVTYIEDILFWIITGIFLILIIRKFSFGEIRLYMFIGLILGGVVYFCTLSKYLIKINVFIMKFFKKILLTISKFVFKIFGKPVNFKIINIKGRKNIKKAKKTVIKKIKTKNKKVVKKK